MLSDGRSRRGSWFGKRETMALTCCQSVLRFKGEVQRTIALAGNPNVGKSSFFNRLTGMGVVTANYPGKTVDVNMGITHFNDMMVGVIDLPGTYALEPVSEDQWVARRALLDARPDSVIAVVDATNIARNLYLTLQLLDLGLPVVVALNLMDEAERGGLAVEPAVLAKHLGVPVIPTVAVRGMGVDQAMAKAVEIAEGVTSAGGRGPRYGRDVEEQIEALAAFLGAMEVELPFGLSPRPVAILLLESDEEMLRWAEQQPQGSAILAETRSAAAEIAERHGEPAPLRLARERHGLAGQIAQEAQARVRARRSRQERLWRLTTAPLTGIPILLLMLLSLFAILFSLGNFLSDLLSGLWAAWVSPPVQVAFALVLGDGFLAKSMLWGFDAGINAALAVGIPYVLTFYLLFSVFEDTGYLNAAAFLTDPLLHRVGLHGRAVIPLVTAAGCNVPAVMATRTLTTMRERVICATLICFVPCSARTAVISGAVSRYLGWAPAIGLYLIVAAVGTAAGWGLSRVVPGRRTGLVMEMFPFRLPSVRNLLRRTWFRFKEFVFVAAPVVIFGSLLLGGLYESGLIWRLAAPLTPLTGWWLGLPAVTGLTLLFGILRKELALQLLVTLAMVQYGRGAADLLHFMTMKQLFVYALVNALFIPCLATIAVLARELAWRRTLLIALFNIVVALGVGGLVSRLWNG